MNQAARNFILAGAMTTTAVMATPRRAEAYDCDNEEYTCEHEGGNYEPGAQLCIEIPIIPFFMSFTIACEINFECEFANEEWNWGGWCTD